MELNRCPSEYSDISVALFMSVSAQHRRVIPIIYCSEHFEAQPVTKCLPVEDWFTQYHSPTPPKKSSLQSSLGFMSSCFNAFVSVILCHNINVMEVICFGCSPYGKVIPSPKVMRTLWMIKGKIDSLLFRFWVKGPTCPFTWIYWHKMENVILTYILNCSVFMHH